MKHRLKKVSRWHLEGFVLNEAHRAGMNLIGFGTRDKRSAAVELQKLLIWFPEARATIIAEARKGVTYLRAQRAKWAAESAAKLKEAA